MLSEPLQLGKVDATKIIDFLYAFFHRDFVANKAYLNKSIYIDPRKMSKYLSPIMKINEHYWSCNLQTECSVYRDLRTPLLAIPSF